MCLDDDVINTYINLCKNYKQLSSDTIKAYIIDLRQFYEFLLQQGEDFSKTGISKYVEHLNKTYKPKTVKRKIASVKAFCSYLYCEEIIDESPFLKIKYTIQEPKILPKTIPFTLIEQILSVAYKRLKKWGNEKIVKCDALRNVAILELLFASGMRVSELCDLQESNLDLDEGTVKILGKGKKERIIQIENVQVIDILRKYSKVRCANCVYYFTSKHNTAITTQNVRYLINNIVSQCTTEKHITPHMFRHSFATLLLDEGVDIRYIQQLLGHSSITTTQIYTQVSSAKQKQILSTMHPRNKMLLNL